MLIMRDTGRETMSAALYIVRYSAADIVSVDTLFSVLVLPPFT